MNDWPAVTVTVTVVCAAPDIYVWYAAPLAGKTHEGAERTYMAAARAAAIFVAEYLAEHRLDLTLQTVSRRAT